MEFKKLSDISSLRNESIKDNKNKDLLYVTTTHLLPNKAGISQEYESSLDKSGKLFYKGDILVSNIRPYFKKIWQSDRDGITSNDVLIFVTNDIVSQKYLYYLLSQDIFFDMMTLTSKGTKMPRGDKNAISKYEVSVFDKIKQTKIVNILTSYDKKIEINKKIITNLEAQAQALFKYYFVDFKPFTDGNFVDSDLGPIPEGWEVVELSDVADFRNGYSFKSKELDDTKTEANQLKVFKMGDISVGGGFNLGKTKSWVSKTLVEEKNISRYILDYGDLLMCMTDMKDNVRLLGHVAYNWFDDQYILNQRVGRITSKSEEITNEYLYFLINSVNFIEELRSRANRGVQVNLSTKEIKASKILVPKTPYLKKYNKFISKIMKYIGYLTNQNQTLAETRDALLPKLMAGEIDLENLGGPYD